MYRLLLATFLALAVSPSWGQDLPDDGEVVDFAQQDPYMSDLYIKGSHLVYDCVSQHWVCTGRPEYERCQEWRERALLERRDNLRCAPVLKFSSQKKCHQEQVKMINMAGPARFCLHPEVKERQRRY